MAVELFFISVDLLEHNLGKDSKTKTISVTHPPGDLRLDALRAMTEAAEKSSEIARMGKLFEDTRDKIMEKLSSE